MPEPLPAPTARERLWGWVLDYAFVTYWMLHALSARSRPDELLRPDLAPGSPVLLIPGVFESWRFMQPVAGHLFRSGHPVHVLDKLGYNTGAIPQMAQVVTDYLADRDLRDVTVIAHSKGGLIGKYACADPATLSRVRHLITVNTPFSGSRYAYLFLLPSVRMFTPTSSMIRQLEASSAINGRISSLYSVFDPHIPETGHLRGAENILLGTIGHFRPLGDPATLNIISTIMAR